MFRVSLVQAGRDGVFEDREILVVDRVQALLFDEFPQSLNEIEVGGIGRQIQQFDAEGCGQIKHQMTLLVARIVEDECDRDIQAQRRNPAQQFANAVGIDVGVVGDHDQLMGDGVQGPQHIEALPPCRRADEQACKAPQQAEIWR